MQLGYQATECRKGEKTVEVCTNHDSHGLAACRTRRDIAEVLREYREEGAGPHVVVPGLCWRTAGVNVRLGYYYVLRGTK